MNTVIWIIVILIYGTIFAIACSYLAGEKGKDKGTWAAIGFFLGIIGLILIGFSAKESGVILEGTKKCDQCAELVLIEAKVCRFCGHEFPSVASIKDNLNTNDFDDFPELPSTSVCIPWDNGIFEGEILSGKPHGLGIWGGLTELNSLVIGITD